MLVFVMVFHVVNGDNANSHLNTLPLLPVKLRTEGLDPEQIIWPGDTAPFTVGELTCMVMVLELTGETPQDKLLVIMQKIWSPLIIVLSTYVALFVPTFNPFLRHW